MIRGFACRPVAALLLTSLLACGGKESNSRAPAAPSRAAAVSLTRSFSIPAAVVADPSQLKGSSPVLTLTAAGNDELAEGPSSFDVFPDGSLVIADPLRQRLVFYDAAGQFRFDLDIHIAAERVRALPGNVLSVVRYQTGERYIFQPDSAGRYQAPRLAAAQDPDPDTADSGVARLEARNLAVVSAQPAPNTEVVPVPVRFEAAGEDMVSVRRLGTDSRQRTYVALEAAAPGQLVNVRTIVRKYSGRGESLVEITDIPLDYYVHPVDEFRLHDAWLYQLMPKANEVRINLWDTSSQP